ncbi:MAG: hypothetical protein C4539_14775 [Ignavibacteriales bacterium]|nr:MAG: hypothetical protein C4539_14775 [Ignavibacteriales bacterium]
MKKTILGFIILVSLIGCSTVEQKDFFEDLAIGVKDTTRVYVFTNKHFGFYYGETNQQFTDDWQGWTLKEKRIFNDYKIYVDDNHLNRQTALTSVYPYKVKRQFEFITEEFFFADSLDLVILQLKNLNTDKTTIELQGLNADKNFSQSENAFSTGLTGSLPGYKFTIFSDSKISKADNEFGKFEFNTRGKDSIKIFFYITKLKPDVNRIIAECNNIINSKRNRLDKLIKDSYIKTNNDELNKAIAWAKISLDALITTQNYKGIWAGLPWFNNNWGRDTFIALPGATLVSGNFDDAKEILLAFAEHQDKNPSSQYYGRIPNLITLNNKIYNTVDGTPWFVIQCYNYFYYTNDIDFLKQIYPALKLAIQATLKNHVDENGFLTHGDQETWMDAQGPDGCYSPRGNRAVEIQALWYKQALYTYEIGQILNDTSFSKSCLVAAKNTALNFEKFFVDTTKNIIYDRLDSYGNKDESIRPNQFFALNEPDLFTYSVTRLKILGNTLPKLVYPYGVLSLAQEDNNFHFYHNYPPYYPKDAAYHNGIIWQWNTGPVVQTLCGFGLQDSAWNLTNELTYQILNRDCVGSIAELMDAFPREGEKYPRLSGTVSQAWSISEYLRNIYQDYLGIRPDAYHKAIYLLPTLPKEITTVSLNQKIGTDILKIDYDFSTSVYKIILLADKIKDSLDVGIGVINRADASYQMKTVIFKGDKLVFEIPANGNALDEAKVLRNEKEIKVSGQVYNEPPTNFYLFEKVKFAQPDIKNLRNKFTGK